MTNKHIAQRLRQKQLQTKRFAKGEKMYDRGWQNRDLTEVVCPHCGAYFVLTDEVLDAIKFYLTQI
jgi:hypothetical protein